MKKLLFLVLLLCLSLATSAEEAVVDGIKYTLDEKSMTAEAAGLADSTLTDIVIPVSIQVEGKDYQVLSIGAKAFNNNHLASITLSEGLKSIGVGAFMYTWKLGQLIIPNSVESIEPCAFENSSIKLLVIGEGIKTIGSCSIRSIPDLSDFYIYAPQMPVFPYDEIDMIDESHWYSVNLYVPEDLVDQYRQSEASYLNEIPDENIRPISKDYESFISSIKTVKPDSNQKEACYSLDGRRLKSPQKGINIIRRSDGTVRKEIVK
jgi:hypothetical protein